MKRAVVSVVLLEVGLQDANVLVGGDVPIHRWIVSLVAYDIEKSFVHPSREIVIVVAQRVDGPDSRSRIPGSIALGWKL